MKNKQRNRSLAVLIGTILGIGGILFIIYQATNKSFPHALGDLTIIQTVQDEDARLQCVAVYYPEQEVKSYKVWKYGNQSGICVVYCFEFYDKSYASNEYETIIRKIENNVLRYSHLRKFEYDGNIVYLFLGRGKVHYLVQNKNAIYWLETDIPTAQNVITSFLTYLKH
ncbi:MAG: hypothetical protein N3A63_00410 [Bacteroidetes bacterium]|nr:hypothetical protein [Bacteroidota bacterium]